MATSVLWGVACTTTPSTSDKPPTEQKNCRCEDGCIEACEVADTKTSYRKVPREPDAPNSKELPQEPPEAFDLMDERLDPMSPDELTRVAGDLGREDELVTGFRADFVRGRGTEVAVLSRTGELAIYRDDDVVARLDFGDVTEPVEGIQLVDDRAEVVVRSTTDGTERLTVCRVIGGAVAKVFEIELGGRMVEFVHLGDERAIRVRESDGSAQVYRWNPWEGMFRVPVRAPTAP